jgi:pyruvate/2-oxoglutarate dehydrogenase complex dihydrolipoamide acyltransferase (E2) component
LLVSSEWLKRIKFRDAEMAALYDLTKSKAKIFVRKFYATAAAMKHQAKIKQASTNQGRECGKPFLSREASLGIAVGYRSTVVTTVIPLPF